MAITLPTASYTLDKIHVSTRQRKMTEVEDAVYKGNPLLSKLRATQGETLESGRQITSPVRYAELTSGGRYTGWGSFTKEMNETLTEATWEWYWYYQTISQNGPEMAMNNGPEAIVNLFNDKMDQGAEQMLEELSDDMLARYNYNVDEGMDSIEAAVYSADPNKPNGTTSAYGDISRTNGSVNQFWIPGGDWCYDTYTAAAVDASTTKLTLGLMRKMLTYALEAPNLIVSHASPYNKLHTLLQPQERFAGDADLADAGFKHVMYEGIPVVVDRHAYGTTSSQRMYFLATKYWRFIVNAHRNFTPPEFVKPPDQDGRIGQIFVGCNLICKNPRFNAALVALAE